MPMWINKKEFDASFRIVEILESKIDDFKWEVAQLKKENKLDKKLWKIEKATLASKYEKKIERLEKLRGIDKVKLVELDWNNKYLKAREIEVNKEFGKLRRELVEAKKYKK